MSDDATHFLRALLNPPLPWTLEAIPPWTCDLHRVLLFHSEDGRVSRVELDISVPPPEAREMFALTYFGLTQESRSASILETLREDLPVDVQLIVRPDLLNVYFDPTSPTPLEERFEEFVHTLLDPVAGSLLSDMHSYIYTRVVQDMGDGFKGGFSNEALQPLPTLEPQEDESDTP